LLALSAGQAAQLTLQEPCSVPSPLVSSAMEQALFIQAPLEAGMAGSISSVGGALHNALMESTLGLCRTELIDGQRSRTGRAEVERETAAWVRWFNTHRLHSSIGTGRPWSSKTSTVPPRPPQTLEVA
jgi:transposase InsO family protein